MHLWFRFFVLVSFSVSMLLAAGFKCIKTITKSKCIPQRFLSFAVEKMDYKRKSSLYIAFPDLPCYLGPQFQSTNSRTTQDEDCCANLSSQYLNQDFDIFVFEPTIGNLCHVSSYINTAITSQKLIRNLPILQGGYSISYSYLSFICHDGDEALETRPNDHKNVLKEKCKKSIKVCRGVCVYLMKDSSDEIKRPEILRTAENLGFQSYSIFSFLSQNTNYLQRKEFDMKGSLLQTQNYFIEKGNSFGGTSHLFACNDYLPVFHSFHRTMNILHKTNQCKEVEQLLERAAKCLPSDCNPKTLKQRMKYPFVVIEGMDAAGKTTLTKTLEKKLNAKRFYTPPAEVEDLRNFFDTMPEIVRRAYYSIGNYIVAVKISEACSKGAVIMDRYWHSTAAYGIANETSAGDIPEQDHEVYIWPSDLLKPDAVIFLSVSEEIRKQRMEGRGEVRTFEEKHLDRDKLFRERLCTAYRRMKQPAMAEVDASGTPDEVVQKAVAVLKNHGISIDET